MIVIEPELEAWVWAASPHVADVLGWRENQADLRPFLTARGLWDKRCPKPIQPKETMRHALREKNKPFGAPLFSELAKRVDVGQCEDPAFTKLRDQLRESFPSGSDHSFKTSEAW